MVETRLGLMWAILLGSKDVGHRCIIFTLNNVKTDVLKTGL